jgi:type II secretory pathway component PulF
MELEEEIKRRMFSVSIMPAFAIVLVSISSSILFLYVLPMIIKAVGKLDKYPFFTRILISCKDVVVDYKYFILVAIACLLFLPKAMRLHPESEYVLDKFLVKCY